MSDELETAGKMGVSALGGATVGGGVWYLIKRAIAKGDRDGEKLASLQAAEVVRLRTELDALKAEVALKAPLSRVDGVAKDHGDRLNEHDRWLTKIDTRQRDALGIADSAEVHTSPGHKLSAEMLAAIDELKKREG